MISNLLLKKFVAFNDLAIKFSPGLNVVAGGNGTERHIAQGHSTQPFAGRVFVLTILASILARKLCRLYQPLGKWANCAGLAPAGMPYSKPPFVGARSNRPFQRHRH
ncbi:MAG: hypothetical protein U5K56_09350 [Halioglobus sp.]|nr:hypothetical protein [Halioglobus sp.]